MKYELFRCPICGSEKIILLSEEQIEKDSICFYKCVSCDSKFNTKDKYLKNTSNTQKRPVQNTRLLVEPLKGTDIFEINKNKVVEIYADFGEEIGAGTGVIISDGLLITNAHVIFSTNKSKNDIAKNNGYKAKFAKQHTEFNIDLKYVSFEDDLAVFNINGGEPVKKAIKPAKIGEKCYAIGNAKGQGICMFDGIVSDSSRMIKGQEFIMFTALVTQGNSGGPLFNEMGELIGIVTMGDKNSSAMNYAIPLRRINYFLGKNK